MSSVKYRLDAIRKRQKLYKAWFVGDPTLTWKQEDFMVSKSFEHMLNDIDFLLELIPKTAEPLVEALDGVVERFGAAHGKNAGIPSSVFVICKNAAKNYRSSWEADVTTTNHEHE